MKTSSVPIVSRRASSSVGTYNKKGWLHIPRPSSMEPSSPRPARRLRITSVIVSVVMVAMVIGQTTATAQVFHDAQRVTAVDLLVTRDRGDLQQWAAGDAWPKDLAPGDFTVRVDDQPVEVIALALPDETPWHFLVYIDAELSSRETLTWAATLLGEQLDALLAKGYLEIVIADPLPRRLLRPTNDREEVERVLAQLALQSTATARLQALRDEFLSHIAEQPADRNLAPLLAAEELAIVARRHDLLATWLVDRPRDAPDPELPTFDRRALLYVSDGFDAEPSAFYDQHLDTEIPEVTAPDGTAPETTAPDSTAAETTAPGVTAPEAPVTETPAPDATTTAPGSLRARAERAKAHAARGLSQILASYGWVSLPMLPPEPELLTYGLRLGKFLIKPMRPHQINDDPGDSARADQHGLRGLAMRLNQLILVGLQVKYEEHRDVDKAEAYLELAQALHGQDKLEDAAEAYEKALFHFSEDPRTADRQAEALAGVGDMMAELGDRQGAQGAYHKALTLNPQLAQEVGTGIAFIDPVGALRPLADATVGRVLRDGGDLRSFLDTTGRKVRLTYQLEDLPQGSLQQVQVTSPRLSGRFIHPRWSRAGTPEPVTEARLRQLLGPEPGLSSLVDGEVTGGAASPPSVQAGVDTQGILQLALRRASGAQDAEMAGSQRPSAVRLSLGSASEEGDVRIVHRRLVLTDQARQVVPGTDLDPEAAAWVVLVEDLETGSWQARMLDLP